MPFGDPITSSHPEVPAAHADPLSSLVLNYVAKLKDVKAQLAQKAARSPQLASLSQTVALLQAAPDTLTALAQSLTAANDSNSKQLAQNQHHHQHHHLHQQQSQTTEPQQEPLINPANLAEAAHSASVRHDQAALDDNDDLLQPAETQSLLAPSGVGETLEANDEAASVEEEDEDESAGEDFDCKTSDCHDLLDGYTTMAPIQHQHQHQQHQQHQQQPAVEWPASRDDQQLLEQVQSTAGYKLPPGAATPGEPLSELANNHLAPEVMGRHQDDNQYQASSSACSGQSVAWNLLHLIAPMAVLLLVAKPSVWS